MVEINIEQIDAVRQRTNVGYKEAKEVLEKFDGNVVDAILYFESQDKVTSEIKKDTDKFYKKGKSFIKKLNSYDLKISKKEKTALDIPLSLGALISLLAPHVVLLVVFICFVKGYKIRLNKLESSANNELILQK